MDYCAEHLDSEAHDNRWLYWGPHQHFGHSFRGRALPRVGASLPLSFAAEHAFPLMLSVTFSRNLVDSEASALFAICQKTHARLLLQPDIPYIAYTPIARSLPPSDRDGHLKGIRLYLDKTAPTSIRSALVQSVSLLPLVGLRTGFRSCGNNVIHFLKDHLTDRNVSSFPLSHFDGTEYLHHNPDIRNAMLEKRCKSALQHYVKFGKNEGRRMYLAVKRPPNPGSLLNLANLLNAYVWTSLRNRAVDLRTLTTLRIQLDHLQEEADFYNAESKPFETAQSLAKPAGSEAALTSASPL
jgi:hypothetical protein